MKLEGEVVITSCNMRVIIICYKQWDKVSLSNAETGKNLTKNVARVSRKWTMSDWNQMKKKPCPLRCNNLRILTFCWPCISVYLYQYLTKLMHKICFAISFISCLYMFRAHVLNIRRSKLHYTASGIIKPIVVMIPEAV